MEINEDKLHQFLGKMVTEMEAAANGALIILGDRLGLFKSLAKNGPITSEQLAESTETTERYVREWLSAQAASGYVEYDSAADTFYMTPEQAAVFGDEESPFLMTGAFYAFSTMICTPSSISQEVGLGLGAQAGLKRLKKVVTSGGFSRFRKAAETPFNLILEARP